MKTLLKKLLQREYDPISYWNKRSNPNNEQGESPERIDFDVNYIKRGVRGCNPILELGPGVGRTFPVYSHGSQISTLDVSRKYEKKLSRIGASLGLVVEQYFLNQLLDFFPFEDNEFPVGVVSQVLLHIPPEYIQHTLSELLRVCKKVVIITAYTHGLPVTIPGVKHVFNHDYVSLSTNLGCAMHDVIMNEGRICFILLKRNDV